MNSNGYVNPRHTALLGDVMTHQGTLQPITRHGGHKRDSVLKQATFESSVRALVAGACAGAMDPVLGLSANLMLGNVVPAGTGMASTLLLDSNACGAAVPPASTRTSITVQGGDDTPAAGDGGCASPFVAPSSDDVGTASLFSPAAFVGGIVDDDDDVASVCFWDDAISEPPSPSERANDDEAMFSPVVSETSSQTSTSPKAACIVPELAPIDSATFILRPTAAPTTKRKVRPNTDVFVFQPPKKMKREEKLIC